MQSVSGLATALQYLSPLSVDNKEKVFIQQVQCMNAPAYVG